MTTDMNIEQERAAFEAWAKGHYILQRSAYNDTYIAVPTIRAWEVWQARAVLQSEQVQAWKRDSERLDFITSKPGVCYALVSDDSGRWALTDTGMSPVAPDQGFTETVGITSIVDPDMWKSSPREAIDAAKEQQK